MAIKMSMSLRDIHIEKQRLLNFLANTPGGVCSAIKEVVREIMLATDGRMLVSGHVFDIKAKGLGAGVYRLTLEEVERGEGRL